MGSGGEIDPGCEAIPDICAHAGGLLFKMHHHLRTLDAIGITGIIFDFGRDGELSAGLDALVKDGFKVCPGGIDGGRIPGRSRANDQTMYFFGHKCAKISRNAKKKVSRYTTWRDTV